MNCIHRLDYGRIVGGFPSEDNLYCTGLLWFDKRKLDFYTLASIMGEIGLIISGWDGRTDQTDRMVQW